MTGQSVSYSNFRTGIGGNRAFEIVALGFGKKYTRVIHNTIALRRHLVHISFVYIPAQSGRDCGDPRM